MRVTPEKDSALRAEQAVQARQWAEMQKGTLVVTGSLGRDVRLRPLDNRGAAVRKKD